MNKMIDANVGDSVRELFRYVEGADIGQPFQLEYVMYVHKAISFPVHIAHALLPNVKQWKTIYGSLDYYLHFSKKMHFANSTIKLYISYSLFFKYI